MFILNADCMVPQVPIFEVSPPVVMKTRINRSKHCHFKSSLAMGKSYQSPTRIIITISNNVIINDSSLITITLWCSIGKHWFCVHMFASHLFHISQMSFGNWAGRGFPLPWEPPLGSYFVYVHVAYCVPLHCAYKPCFCKANCVIFDYIHPQ